MQLDLQSLASSFGVASLLMLAVEYSVAREFSKNWDTFELHKRLRGYGKFEKIFLLGFYLAYKREFRKKSDYQMIKSIS